MKFLVVAVVTVLASRASAQTPEAVPALPTPSDVAAADAAGVATRTGHHVSVSVGHYAYSEPGALRISIHGPRLGAQYTGTLVLNERRRWFASADLRGSVGNVTYDGWCLPFLIRPNSSSPNGYELDLGDASPCSEGGVRDWYLDVRALVGKDFVAGRWGLSPDTGLGLRHLSNGTAGGAGYRTDEYLYVPLGLTARTRLAQHLLQVRAEGDVLLHGWQTTRGSKLGGGDLPSTATAPAFTIDGFDDVSFAQHWGLALRAGVRYEVTSRWSVQSSFVHWTVGASPVAYQTVMFTVNGVTARQQWGVYEPVNATTEFSAGLGLHF